MSGSLRWARCLPPFDTGYTLFRASGVGIDVYNVEAEASGAVLAEPEGNAIPACAAHPCGSAADIVRLPALDPARDGRVPMVVKTAARLAVEFADADVRVPVSGPFSIAVNLG
jgi:hypothetical protein